jgi:hypothetical protein
LVMSCKPLASQFISCSVPFVQPLLSRSMRDPCAEKNSLPHRVAYWFLVETLPLSCVKPYLYMCVCHVSTYPHLHVSIRIHLYATSPWHRSHLHIYIYYTLYTLSQIFIDEI